MRVGRDCGVTTLRWGVDSSWSSSLSSLCTEAACSSSITCREKTQNITDGCGGFGPAATHAGKTLLPEPYTQGPLQEL